MRWSEIRLPTEEGGLGIRGIDQIQSALHAKLMWMVMLDQSLWARIMSSKYYDGYKFVVPSNASPLWRSIVTFEQHLTKNSRWIVGSGNAKFWVDNWLGQALVGPQPVDADLSIKQGLEIIDELKEFIHANLLAQISSVSLDSRKHTLIYMPSDRGRFSTKEFMKAYRRT